jgi:hypothetical protein
VKGIHPLAGVAVFVLVAYATRAAAGSDFPLAGNYTQNVPCKGDGSDPDEVRVKISAQEIDSKAGVCNFVDSKLEGRNLHAHVECHFPAGPLMGDVTFTMQPDNTVKFIDRDQNYRAVLYRCPK